MRLTALFMTVAIVNVSAKGVSQNITFSGKDVPLETVFRQVESQSGYFVLYSQSVLSKAKNVSIEANNEELSMFLQMVFADQPLSYSIKDKNIIVTPAAELSPRLNLDAPPIKGVIRDADGNPVQGVNVVLKGTKKGVTTDAYGNFSIEADANEVLVISSVGFSSKEVKVSNTGVPLIVALDKNVSQLDEVQYIAYGTTSKRYSVGNVTTVKGADIEKQPVNNVLLALQGRVPGLEVTQQTGVNGGAVKVRVQGENSIKNGNNPLVVIDGVPYPTELPYNTFSEYLIGNDGYGSPLSFINLNDIESVDVLKDADATSIYGSRAANGAILITTKKGKPGKMKININLQQGWSEVTRKMDMLNTRQYLDMRYEAMKNAALIPAKDRTRPEPYNYAPDLTLWDTTRYTDWQKVLIGATARYSNFNASISGGTPNTSYLVGMTYTRNTDVFPGDYAMKSGALHFNLNTTSVDQKFKLQLNGNYTVTDNSLPGEDLTASAIKLVPVAPVLFVADSLNWAPNADGIDTWSNPLSSTYYRRYGSTARVLFSNAVIGYTILPGLELKSQLGYSTIQSQSNSATLLVAYRPSARPFNTRQASFNNTTINTLIAEPLLSYTANFGSINLDALLGSTIQQNKMQTMQMDGSGYTSDLLLDGINGAGAVISTIRGSIYKYNALFARLGFNWDGKYLLSMNGRRDGSSRFGDKRRFHNFGSIGLGWIFSDEKWLRNNLAWLNFGKIRISYGTTGNDQIGDYSYLSSNIPSNPGILYQGAGSMIVTNLFNPYLQWEDTHKWSGGIDVGFWKDRILLSVTYARNRSSNQLLEYSLPSVTGFPFVLDNFPATLQNTSWEFMLNSVNLKNRDWKWTSSLNLTIPNNKVVAFPGIEKSSYAGESSGIIVGQPKGIRKLASFLGLDPATGRYVGADINGNPTLTPIRNRYINMNPLYYGGFQNALTYKSFQLDFLFQFMRRWGSNQFDYWNGEFGPGYVEGSRGNQTTRVLDRWRKPGDKALVAPYSSSVTYEYSYSLGSVLGISDGYYSMDASYLRLKNLSLSWQIPVSLLKKIGLQSGRLYTQGQNLLTFSQYSGLDPETQSITSLPPLRTWTLGIQIGL